MACTITGGVNSEVEDRAVRNQASQTLAMSFLLASVSAYRYFKAGFVWRPPVARTWDTPRERPLVGAKTTPLTRKTPPSAPRDVSHALVLATRGPRDAVRAHRGHSRPPRNAVRGCCLLRARPASRYPEWRSVRMICRLIWWTTRAISAALGGSIVTKRGVRPRAVRST
jgi:hypothetical protein